MAQRKFALQQEYGAPAGIQALRKEQKNEFLNKKAGSCAIRHLAVLLAFEAERPCLSMDRLAYP
jgi:hypothetical protein